MTRKPTNEWMEGYKKGAEDCAGSVDRMDAMHSELMLTRQVAASHYDLLLKERARVGQLEQAREVLIGMMRRLDGSMTPAQVTALIAELAEASR